MKKIMMTAIIASAALAGCALESTPSVKNDHPANVTFQFQNENDDSVLTFWRKIEDDGTKGTRFYVGIDAATGIMNTSFPKYSPTTKQLDPGIYYLDSFQVPVSGKANVAYCVSEKTHYLLRNGWDDENKKPLFLSFSVKENQNLTLPVVKFDTECAVSFSDPGKVFNVGDKLKRK